jgi:hypothetical protein
MEAKCSGLSVEMRHNVQGQKKRGSISPMFFDLWPVISWRRRLLLAAAWFGSKNHIA